MMNGDCIDCKACVRVCPTGIDIRNGTQLDCINCTACMDACDAIMISLKKPIGLIRYASENSISENKRLTITNRVKAYSVVLLLLLSFLIYLLISRNNLDARLMRTSGQTYTSMLDGRISNLYNLKLINKTHDDITIRLKLENVPGEISLLEGKRIVVKKSDYESVQFFVKLNRATIKSWKTTLVIGLYDSSTRINTIRATFIGPEIYN